MKKNKVCKENFFYFSLMVLFIGFIFFANAKATEELKEKEGTNLLTDYKEIDYSKNKNNTYSSSSSNSSDTRTPIATCKYSNPVDCAIRYIKDNYNVSKWTSSDDIEAYQNTVTNDYVIYVTIKGENAFGGTVQNTFEVTTDEDSKNIYSCIRQ